MNIIERQIKTIILLHMFAYNIIVLIKRYSCAQMLFSDSSHTVHRHLVSTSNAGLHKPTSTIHHTKL